MREHLLCPSTEGCHVLARPWCEPLGDFAVEEFLALLGLFRDDSEEENPSHPLGDPKDVEDARARMRHARGPSPVKVPLSDDLASRIGARLVSGTLHAILCEGRDCETLREDIMARYGTDESGDAVFLSSARGNSRPHVMLQRFPGATKTNGGGPLVGLGTKKRKRWLLKCLSGTSLDPERDDEIDGCGADERRLSFYSRGGNEKTVLKNRKNHLCVVWVSSKNAFCLTQPLECEKALEFVRQCGGVRECPRDGDGDDDGDVRNIDSYADRSPGDGLEDPPGVPNAALETAETDAKQRRAAPPTACFAAVLANISRITSGSLVFDPFCGTGGFIRPAVVLGAPFALGMDVSPIQPRAGAPTDRFSDADFVAGNAFRVPIRRWIRPQTEKCTLNRRGRREGIGFFDAIVCDPPYGLRAPRIAARGEKDAPALSAAAMEAAVARFVIPVFELAGGPHGLTRGGRLVYLFPTHRSKLENVVMGLEADPDWGADLGKRRMRRDESDAASGDRSPVAPPHPSLRLVGTCAQEFKGMTRTAVIYEKL
jgi:predicted RNA methylase